MEELYMEEKIMIYLMHLKITPNLKGYKYMKEAALRLCKNSGKKYYKTNELIKELSSEMGEKASLYDRAIRHAVEVSFKRDGIRAFERFMRIDFSVSKPTAKEILHVLAEKLKVEVGQKFHAQA